MIAKPYLKFDINFMFIDSIFFADKFYKFKLDVSEFGDISNDCRAILKVKPSFIICFSHLIIAEVIISMPS
jgi:hypothetical protein